MVSSPSIFYKADEVHLFRYIRDPGTASAKLYEDHFQSVCRQIRSSLPECLVTEHTDDPVYDLPRMVRAQPRRHQRGVAVASVIVVIAASARVGDGIALEYEGFHWLIRVLSYIIRRSAAPQCRC